MPNYKIVLTGEPCGGKTASLDFLAKKLRDQDYSVKIVQETANSLLNLGYMPSVNISTFDFQNLLFKIQFLKEYIAEGKANILLCDRGLFDGKVYIDTNDFRKILDLNKVKEEEISRTYDGVLYFRSIAYEYPDEFLKKRIYERLEVTLKSSKLSDYYDREYFKYIYNGINDILAKNDVSFDIKIKTRELIR